MDHNLGLSSQQVQQGLSAAQTVFTVLGSIGAIDGIKWVVVWFRDRREQKRKAAADAIAAAVDAEKKDRTVAHEARKDAVVEWQGIAAEREKQTHDCHDRLSKAEKRLDDCEQDRTSLRNELAAHGSRLTKLENGNGQGH